MSGSISDVIGAQTGANVLSGIAHPAQLNVLGAYKDAAATASTIYDLKGKQADQAWGQALQQATDENGNVDYPKAQSIAAHNPMATQGMLRALPITSQLTGEQQDNIKRNMTTVAQHAATIGIDPSDENVNAVVNDLKSRGMPEAQAEGIRSQLLSMKPTQRQQFASRAGLAAMDAANAAKQVGGTTTGQDVGGAIQPYTLRQNIPGYGGASMTPAPGGAGKTLTPGEASAYGIVYPATQKDVDAGLAGEIGAPVHVPGFDVIKRFGYGGMLPPGAQIETAPPATGGSTGGGGVTDSTGKKVGPTNPPRLLKVPGAPAATPPPAAPAAAPPATPPPATSPAAPQGVPITANPLTPPGVQVASANAAFAPSVGPPGPPAAGTAGDVNALLAGVNAARAARGATPIVPAASFSVGPGAEEAQGWKVSADKLAADDLAAADFQKTQFPYVQALANYGEGTKTGPTTDFWNQVAGTIRTPLAKLGVNIGGLSDTTARVDALGKWLASIQSGNPISAKSDAELAQVLKGSASTHINEVAGEDMVKAGLALQRMNVALNGEWHSNRALQSQYGTYLQYLRSAGQNIDPRAFSVDMLNSAQKARLRDQLKSGGEENAVRFEASLALARRNGLIGGAGSQAMP